jgi:hypothetical protein
MDHYLLNGRNAKQTYQLVEEINQFILQFYAQADEGSISLNSVDFLAAVKAELVLFNQNISVFVESHEPEQDQSEYVLTNQTPSVYLCLESLVNYLGFYTSGDIDNFTIIVFF